MASNNDFLKIEKNAESSTEPNKKSNSSIKKVASYKLNIRDECF